jgi:hypothetical protein
MAKQIINIGTAPNTGTGDPLRTAFTKINENFADTEFSHLELITTEVAFVGPIISFTKTNYGFEVDYIDEGLAITRGDAQGIFNIAVEEQYDRDNHTSPANTEWNADGWEDLANVTSRTYTTWRESLGTNVAEIVGQELIMHDLTNDKYYGIKFTQWTQGIDPGGEQGGGFAYERQLIDVNAGKGITFPDNSVQRKAVNDVSDLFDEQKLLEKSSKILTTDSKIGALSENVGGGPEREGATLLDLTKSVHKLSEGIFKIPDGEEGQIIYLVQQKDSSSSNIRVYVNKCRIGGTEYDDNYIEPFITESNIVIMIYTDGAWQSNGGQWD